MEAPGANGTTVAIQIFLRSSVDRENPHVFRYDSIRCGSVRCMFAQKVSAHHAQSQRHVHDVQLKSFPDVCD